jgi:hypothetical protein
MARIVQNILIHDNGIRTFVPPCFNWELLAEDGTIVDVVSSLVISEPRTEDICIEQLVRDRIRTSGEIDVYPVESAKGVTQEGKRYTITKIEN